MIIMDPKSSDSKSGSSLPPIGNQLPQLSKAFQQATQANISASISKSATASGPQISDVVQSSKQTSQPQHSSLGDAQNTSQSSIPEVAADSDLIEKEWVIKAKQIVLHTKDDPHEQSRQLTIFKAAYIKQRYNRTIQLDEE
jgi:hypothetical protein